MARYRNTLKAANTVNDTKTEIEQYLVAEGFKQVRYKGEQVWKKGVGLLLGPQYVKLTQRDDGIGLEAWIRFALLPGVYIGEMGIDGLFGLIPKKRLKKRIREIEGRAQTQISVTV